MNSILIFVMALTLMTCSEGFMDWNAMARGESAGGFGKDKSRSERNSDLLRLTGVGAPNVGNDWYFRPRPEPDLNIGNVAKVERIKTRSADGDFATTALAETNKYRAMHGAEPLTLDPQLSADCEAWAENIVNSGQFKHSCSMCMDYGENLWMTRGRLMSPADAAKAAVKSWYSEVKDYDWNNPTFSFNTGHFTALVWKGTTTMGIGIATNLATKSTYVVARYVPAGNMEGAFAENVGPLEY